AHINYGLPGKHFFVEIGKFRVYTGLELINNLPSFPIMDAGITTMANDYLFGGNAVFIGELYDQYKLNPSSVDASWRELFAKIGGGSPAPSWAAHKNKIIGVKDDSLPPKPANKNEAPTAAESGAVDSIRALMLIRAYRERGHTNANLD